jgi:WD40 repeat protein/predicted Ser/Thr protein kinase
MGEVYRARDARLNRDVAIKVLPTGVADNPTRRARFTREAQAIAQLSHPHICAVYDVGEEDGIAYLVMEYIEGQSLEQRLRFGPLPWATTLSWAIQMASAIQAAHRRGIVHRDLKPANIMIAESGVKLLDFGLAKLLEGSEAVESARASQPTETVTSEQPVVGTLAYMSPEQLEGRPIDARTDVFAFGVTLYEMVTGHQAFDGASAASISAAILTSEPPSVSASVAGDPVASAALDHVVRRALAKDPDERWQTARDLTLELRWILEGRARTAPVVSSTVRRRAMIAAGAVLSLAAAAVLGWYGGLMHRPPAAESSIEFTVGAPPGTTVGLGYGVALSPDGRKIAFSAGPDGGPKLLYWRSFDSPALHPILGTDGVTVYFWSPDSARIGFYAENNQRLKLVSLAGGAPKLIVNVEKRWLDSSPSAYWAPDGTIVFGRPGGLYRVPETGGEPTLVTALGSMPAGLPGGRWMYREKLGDGSWVIQVVGPGLSMPVTLPVSSNAVFAAGYLVFREGESLVARPFDDRAVRFTGPPVTLSDSVAYNPANGRTSLTASGDFLAFMPQIPGRLTRVDRSGNRQGSIGEVGRDFNPSLAPDQSGRVGLDRWDPVTATYHVWILDDQQRPVQLTHGGRERWATWSGDAMWVAYWFKDADTSQIRRTRSNGGGEEILVTGIGTVPLDLNAEFLLYHAGTNADLFAKPLGGGDPIPITSTPTLSERSATFSPDGRWVAYTSSEGGQENIWVQEFPSGASRHAVTTTGGTEPRWCRDCRELFYLTRDGTLAAVPVTGPGTFGTPKPLFKYVPGGPHLYCYAPSANGQQFLVNERADTPGAFTVVAHWTSRVR